VRPDSLLVPLRLQQKLLSSACGFMIYSIDNFKMCRELICHRDLKIDVYGKRQTASEVFDFTTLL
jgi:hypothetical protein